MRRTRAARAWGRLFLVVLLGLLMFPGGARERAWAAPRPAAVAPTPGATSPYDFKALLTRAEEHFRENNYRDALIFYYESLAQTTSPEVSGKIHFRLGECLEAIRRFEFAEYHYKKALLGGLSEALAARAALKLKHLPKLAQHEEATRLYKKAMAAYKRRDIRGSLDDYLKSLQLEPALMGQDESGLIDDAIQYLTFLSESKNKEPDRLLKLATFLELRGETEKALETLKQILIIYPNSEEAGEAEEKVAFYTQKRSSYVEFRKPHDGLADLTPKENPVVFESQLEFRDPGVQSKEMAEYAYTFRAGNEQPNVPDHRFEVFTVVLGKGENQKEFVFRADEGIAEKLLSYDDGTLLYQAEFQTVDLTTAYVRDIYGEGVRAAPLFSGISVKVTISRK